MIFFGYFCALHHFSAKRKSSSMIMVVFPPTRKNLQDSHFTCSFTRLSFSMLMSGPLSSSSPCTLTMKYIYNHTRSNIEAAHLMIDRSTPLVFIQSTSLSCQTVRARGLPDPDDRLSPEKKLRNMPAKSYFKTRSDIYKKNTIGSLCHFSDGDYQTYGKSGIWAVHL